MKNFTNEQNKKFMEQAQEIMNKMSEGENVRDVMAKIYVDSLEDKTTAQGLVIADSIIESVQRFETSYKAAKEDLDGYIKKFQKKMDEGKTCVERCNFWLKMAASISAANIALSDPTVDRKKLIEEMELITPLTEGEATPQKEKELREKAFEVIKNSGIMLNGLMDYADRLEATVSPEEAAELIISIGDKDADLKAIASMIAYTQVKTGNVEEIPADVTASQITTIICAGIEEVRIIEAVGNGSMLESVAAALLFVLGAVVIIETVASLALAALTYINMVFPALLVIPAILVLTFGIYKLLTKGITQWDAASEKFVKIAFAVGKYVFKGIKAIALFVKEKVIDKIVEFSKKIFISICSHLPDKKENKVENPTMVPAT